MESRKSWCEGRCPTGWAVAAVGALAVVTWLASPVAAGEHPHTRQGWLVGFGVGVGGSETRSGAGTSDRSGGFAGSVRAGYAFSPKISLELDGSLWSWEEDGATVAFTVSGVGFNFYPGGQGLVLRAGVGSGTGRAAVRTGNTTVTRTEEGVGVLGGVAYEFRVTPRFALGPQVHIGWIDVDTFKADWVNVEVGLQWYFIPR